MHKALKRMICSSIAAAFLLSAWIPVNITASEITPPDTAPPADVPHGIISAVTDSDPDSDPDVIIGDPDDPDNPNAPNPGTPIGISYKLGNGTAEVTAVPVGSRQTIKVTVNPNGTKITGILLLDCGFLGRIMPLETDFEQKNEKGEHVFTFENLLYTGKSNLLKFRVFYQQEDHIISTDISFSILQALEPVETPPPTVDPPVVEDPKPIAILTPQVKVISYTTSERIFLYDNKYTITLNLMNISSDVVYRNVFAEIPVDSGAIVDGSNRIFLGDLAPSETMTISFPYMFNDSVRTGITPFLLNFDFEYKKDDDFVAGTSSEYISIRTQGKSEEIEEPDPDEEEEFPDKMVIQSIKFPAEMMPEDEESFIFSVVNKGYGTAFHVEVNLYDDKNNQLATAYLGHMEPGKEFHEPKFALTFPDEGIKKFKFVLNYDDYQKNPQEIVKEFSINVSSGMDEFPDDGFVDVFDPMPPGDFVEDVPPEGGLNPIVVVLIIVGVIGLGVGTFFTIKTMKKKKIDDFIDDEL